MALPDLADRLIVEAWTGPLDSNDLQRVGELITELGSAYGAALQMLLMKRAQFSTTASVRSAGDDSSNHTANLKALNELIRDLVATMGGLDTFTPSQVELNLMLSATAAPGLATATIDLVTSSPRRG